METQEDYWLKDQSMLDENFSVSAIDEEDNESNLSSDQASGSDKNESESEGLSDSGSDSDEMDEEEPDEPEEEKKDLKTGRLINPAQKMNPNLPVMFKRNKKSLIKLAKDLKIRTVWKQIEEYRPK